MFSGTADEHGVADVHDRVINHIFGSGLKLAGLAGYPGVDPHVAQRLLEVIEELDTAVHEIRSAALGRILLWTPESDGLVLSASSGMPFTRRVGGTFFAIESQLPLCYETVHATRASAPCSDLATDTGLDEDVA